jgi:CysZ protein
VIPVIGFCISGFFLAVELTAVAFQRRGVPLKSRLRLLRGRLLLTLGFGVPLALLFLLPLVAVFAMPGAVAGATLLARDLLPPEGDGDGESDGGTRGLAWQKG